MAALLPDVTMGWDWLGQLPQMEILMRAITLALLASASFVLASHLVPQPWQPNQASTYVTQITHDPQCNPEHR